MKSVKRDSGFSLIEVMVTIGIFGVIMLAVNTLYLSGTRTYGDSVKLAQMRMQTQRAVHEIEKDLIDCRIIDGGNMLDQINFQKPTPRMRPGGSTAADRRYIESGDAVNWGDGELEIDGSPDIHVGNWIRLEFVSAGAISEGADRVDYNGDNDLLDSFERGRIERSVWRPQPAPNPPILVQRRALSGNWLFKAPIPTGQPGVPGSFTDPNLIASMDIDGLNGPDPLFLIVDGGGSPSPTGVRIQVRVFSMSVLNRVPVSVNCASLVTPINR